MSDTDSEHEESPALNYIRYVTFALGFALAFGVLVHQMYIRHQMLYHDKLPTKYLILPVFNTVLVIDMGVTVVGLIVNAATKGTVAFHVFLLLYFIYDINPLVLIYTKSFPKTTWGIIGLMSLSSLGMASLIIFDILAPSETEFYIFLPICIVVVIVLVALLFYKHARTYKNIAVITHTALIVCFIGLSNAINYYDIFKDDPQARIYIAISRSIVWFMSAITSMWIMFWDSMFWRGLADTRALLHDIETSTPILSSDLSEAFMNLVRNHGDIFIEYSYFKVGPKIAVGGRSRVHEAEYKKKKVALKIYKPAELTKDTIDKWSKEVTLSVLLEHPNVIKCYGLAVVPPEVMVAFEFCSSNLIEFLTTHRIGVFTKLLLMIDIACGLNFLHKKGIIHRDMKAENIMIDDTGNREVAKIIDFGESRYLSRNEHTMTIVGTPHYLAPEVLRPAPGEERSAYDQKIDIYSLAIVYWEIMNNGRSPYPEEWSIADILKAVRAGYRPDVDTPVAAEAPEVMELIVGMWSTDAKRRPKINYVYHFLLEYMKSRISNSLGTFGETLWTERDITYYFIRQGDIAKTHEAIRLIEFIRQHDIVRFSILEGISEQVIEE